MISRDPLYSSFSFHSDGSVSTIKLRNICFDTETLHLLIYCDDNCHSLKEKTVEIGHHLVIQSSPMPLNFVTDKKGIYWLSGAQNVYQGSFELVAFLLHLISNIPLYPSVRIQILSHLDSSVYYSLFTNSIL